MKTLKIVILAGVVLIIAALIWSAADPESWDILIPLFLGIGLLGLGLLGLIIFYVYSLTRKAKEQPQDLVVVKKTKTPAIAGILYIILPLLLFFYYSMYEMRIYALQIYSIPFIIAGLTGIFVGTCLLLRRFWWFSLTGAILIIILVLITFGYYFYKEFHISGFEVTVLILPFLFLLFLILLLLLVFQSKKEFTRRSEKTSM